MLSRSDAAQLALLWVGTPYVTGGHLIGAGCDCASLISEYLIGIGAADEIPLFTYSQDWFCHTEEERYFDELSKYAKCIWQGRCLGTPPAKPGDVVIFKANIATGPSPRYNHGAIVTGWPYAVHAFDNKKVAVSRPALHPLTAYTAMAIFDPWEARC